MEEKKRLGRTMYVILVWIVLLLALLVTATYAWFTFSPYTKVTPLSSKVGKGDSNLLISNRENGTFDKECTLTPDGTGDALSPLSTVDLSKFYVATAQNRNGMSILFADGTKQVDTRTVHGKVYLKCENGTCDVYLRRSGLDLGKDAQVLSALRLGLQISTSAGKHTYILKLDALGNTNAATAKRTVPKANTVVSAVDAKGNASFVPDPSLDIGKFLAKEQGPDDKEPKAGETALCKIGEGEVVPVEYWLYLEGCDDNCIGDVQKKDIGLQLAFAGVMTD